MQSMCSAFFGFSLIHFAIFNSNLYSVQTHLTDLCTVKLLYSINGNVAVISYETFMLHTTSQMSQMSSSSSRPVSLPITSGGSSVHSAC